MALLKLTGNKKVNLDFNKEFINTFSEKIKNGNIKKIYHFIFINVILLRFTIHSKMPSN